MLLHNLVPSPVETALPFGSNHGKEDVFCEWVLTKTWKSCSEWSEYPQDGSNLLITSNSYAIPDSNEMSKRRKLQEESLTILPVEMETKGPTGSVKSVPTKANTEYDIDNTEYDIDVGVKVATVEKCKKDIGSMNEPVVSELLSKGLDKENNFSAMKLEIQVGFTTTWIQAGGIVKCSNSELVSGKDLSGRDLCGSILRSHGLLIGDCPETTSASNKLQGNAKDNNTFQSCNLCCTLDNILNMLICDHCEAAFHVSCCNPKIKMLPIDEWFCQSCSKLDGKVSLEASFLKSKNISWLHGNSKLKSGPIALMLKWPGPYISRVRIGDSYQAAVPEWRDQVSKYLKRNSISNWLQCREVLHDHTSKYSEGTICRKWRRATLSEIQTDEWD